MKKFILIFVITLFTNLKLMAMENKIIIKLEHGDVEIELFALIMVSFSKLQYRSIDRLASSLPGIGKSIPSGSEFVSSIAIIGIFNFIDSFIASDS